MSTDIGGIFDIQAPTPHIEAEPSARDKENEIDSELSPLLRMVAKKDRNNQLFLHPKYKELFHKNVFEGRDLDTLLVALHESDGFTDLIIPSAGHIQLKHDKAIIPLLSRALSHEEVKEVVEHMYDTDRYHYAMKPGKDVDEPYEVSVKNMRYPLRNRVNVCSYQCQRGRGLKITLRKLPAVAPTYDDLNVPKMIRKHATPRDGLVVVAGETGSGKSTLCASIIDAIKKNEGDPRLTLTYEKPIEFIFYNVPGHPVFQHSIGEFGDFKTFHKGLENALRNGPEVIFLGESREKETFETLPKIAESGHLGITTMHARSVSNIFTRVKNEVGDMGMGLVRQMVQYMGLAVYQWLAPCTSGGVVPIQEILHFSEEVKEKILQVEDNKLIEQIANMVKVHGQTLQQSAQAALDAGQITEATYRLATNTAVSESKMED